MRRSFRYAWETAKIIATGKIGTDVAQILTGMECRVLENDPFPKEVCRSLGVRYVEFEEEQFFCEDRSSLITILGVANSVDLNMSP